MIRGTRRPFPLWLAAPLLGALAGLVLLGGCSARHGARSAPVAAGGIGCLEAHLAGLEQRQLTGGVAGSGKVQFVSADGRGRASFDFVFRRPDSLRLQFLSPLGPAAAVLDLSGDHYLFADFRQGVFLQGQAGGGDFHCLTGLPASARTLIAILLAEPTPGNSEVGLLRFEEETCLPLSCTLNSVGADEPPVAVEYRWPRSTAGLLDAADSLLLPDRVVFSGPEASRQTTIRFKRVRPLSEAEKARDPDPVDITGLRPAVPGDTEETGSPRWLR